MWSFSARSLTSFPHKRFCRHSRASGNPVTCAIKTLGPRLAVPRNFALRARFRGDDECAFRSAVARLGVGLVLSGALVACGFHLRGEAHYTFDTLFLNSPAAQPLTMDLKRSLEGIGTAQLVPSPETAQVILDITSVENNKQILSLSGGGKVREFLLTKRVLFRVRDSAGNDWLPTSEVLVRRSYTYNDTEALAREAQEQRLWREMQDDAVAQIVRRLQQAKKPA